MFWASFKEFVAEEPRLTSRGRKGAVAVVVVIVIFYFVSLIMFFFFIDQFRKLRTFVTRHGRVNSVDVEGPLYTGRHDTAMWRAIWKVIIIDEEDQRLTETEQTVRSTVSYGFKSLAEREARKKQIGEIYECYRYRIYGSGEWTWIWSKPSKLKVSIFLLIFLVLFTTASTLFILRKYYQSFEEQEQHILQFNQTEFN